MTKRKKANTLESKKRKKCRKEDSETEEKTDIQSHGKKTHQLSEPRSLSENLMEMSLKSTEIKNNCSGNSGNIPLSQKDSLTCGVQKTSKALENKGDLADDVLSLSQVSSGKFVPVFCKPKKSPVNVLGTKGDKMMTSIKTDPENSKRDKLRADICTPSVTRTVFSSSSLQIQPSQPCLKQDSKGFKAQENAMQSELECKEAVLSPVDYGIFIGVPPLEVQVTANSAEQEKIHTQEEVVDGMHLGEAVFRLTAQQQHMSPDVSSGTKAAGGLVISIHGTLSEPLEDVPRYIQAVPVMPLESDSSTAEDHLFVLNSRGHSEIVLDSSEVSLEHCSTVERSSLIDNQQTDNAACLEGERNADISMGETAARNCDMFGSEQVNEVKEQRESGLELPQNPDISVRDSDKEEKGTTADNQPLLEEVAEQGRKRPTESSKDVLSLTENHALVPVPDLVTSDSKSEMYLSDSQLRKHCLAISEKEKLQNTSFILDNNIFSPGPLLNAANGYNEEKDVLSEQEVVEFGISFRPQVPSSLEASVLSVAVLENKQTTEVFKTVEGGSDTEMFRGMKNNYCPCTKSSTEDTPQQQINYIQKDLPVHEMKGLSDMLSDLDMSNISPVVASEAGECVPSPSVAEGVVYVEENILPKDQAVVPVTLFFPESKSQIASTDSTFLTHLQKLACPITAGRKRNGRCDLLSPLCSGSASQLEKLEPRHEILQEQYEITQEDATDVVCGLITELSDLNRLIMSTHRELVTVRKAKLRKEKQVGRFPQISKGKSNALYLPKGKNYKSKQCYE